MINQLLCNTKSPSSAFEMFFGMFSSSRRKLGPILLIENHDFLYSPA
jgi:hypothetical protein